MKKFVVSIFNNDSEQILGLYDTKNSALMAGKIFSGKYRREQGIISCFSDDFDDSGNRIGGNVIFYRAWV